MKKVKIMLTAVTVFAVVGGALAFKAKKFGTTVYCSTTTSSGANCQAQQNKTFIENLINGTSYCTDNSASNRVCDVRADLQTQD